ncbi:unnamed protein product [Rotaria socialis]|uniref:ADP ribosyltransferase domain-containing protein n=2 Tax=Rotaria socialis TaxID=392032 RepID=A0A820IEW7_9BILA|nr:unnamed protein product [Rotaria socialis]CAF3441651.1 unnamed protein product [Rotaria socialis]CAF3670279.1 unnamed protein product [Rotaria socialis]CAF4110526.1 unnamed protein product [Rotaria socialis]CAF4307746.1 unnamed protein product [Rotaria socialis]
MSKSSYYTNDQETAITTRIVENFIIVWLDLQQNELDENLINQFRQTINSIYFFSDTEQCIEYISRIQDEQIFMVIANSFDRQYMPAFEQMSQLNSIYFLSIKKIDYKEYKKVKGNFNRIENIFKELKLDLYLCQRNLTPISMVNSNSINNFNELDESFLCSQLIKEISVSMKRDENAKKQYLEFCRVQYAGNEQQLKIIDQFEREYTSLSPIWWYTRDCFTYSMLNKALRKQDTELIIRMGFFIRDLNEQIEQIYAKMGKPSSLTVYRGQGMAPVEFEKLLNNKSGLLSFNNFFSASTDRQVSLSLAKQSSNNLYPTSVLFQMNINPLIATSPFAYLDKISYYSNNKKGIIFPMHTIFRIDEIKQIEKYLWQINLTLTSSNDEQLVRLTEYTRVGADGETGMHRMAKLMLVMSKMDKAKEIYSALLDTTSSDDKNELAHLHHQIAYVYEQKNDLANALSHYDQALNIYLTYLPFNDPKLCPTYSNIGLILKKQGNLNHSLEFLEHALDIDLIASKPDPIEIAILYINIGGVYDAEGKSAEALEHYENALEIIRKHLPPYHPLIGATHNNIALVHFSLKDYSTALKHFQETLEIEQKKLAYDHPSLIMTHMNIAGVLEGLQRYKEAAEHAEKAASILRDKFSDDNPQVTILREYLDHLRQKQ